MDDPDTLPGGEKQGSGSANDTEQLPDFDEASDLEVGIDVHMEGGQASDIASHGGPAWIILPTYNEASTLQELVSNVLKNLPSSAQVLIVDDGSPDGTGELAARLASTLESVNVLQRMRMEGLGPAYAAGFRYALERGAGLVVEMQTDFIHDPAYLPHFLAASVHADIVLGSRYHDGGGAPFRTAAQQAIGRVGNRVVCRLLGLHIRDVTCGFACFRRPVVEAVDLDLIAGRGIAFHIELIQRAIGCGVEVVEIPVAPRSYQSSSSKRGYILAAEPLWRVPLLGLRSLRRAS